MQLKYKQIKSKMKVISKKIYNSNGQETGCILCVSFGTQTNVQQKLAIENQLIQYAFDTLYPSEGLNIFRDAYVESPSVTVIRNINNLPNTEITI
jgi:hypothetical protein